MADPAALPRLSGTRREVETIASLIPGSRILLGADASEQNLVDLNEAGRLAHFDVLHFATHALIDEQRPERSVLVLSQVGLPDPLEAIYAGRRLHDGLLSANEISHEWRLDADLVTLSACRTSLGRRIAGEGFVGFATTLFLAGARNLLVSLWDVDDAASALLMARFYEHYGAGLQAPVALRRAKLAVRDHENALGARPYEAPYSWAGFVLYGHGSIPARKDTR